jgi:hypothetical protein
MNAEERAAAWLEHQRRRWMRPDWERWMKRSRDPRIRNYNLRIFMRELQFQLRRGPRRID